jgi:NTP pyrophosphatase (non-canonical NTP hydrolase)
MTTFDDYQKCARETAIYPESGVGSMTAISYCALGVTGEAGEIANKVKKLLRDPEDSSALKEAILGEIGDTLWYLAMLSMELRSSLSAAASKNILKLAERSVNGSLHGSGDNR